MFFLQFCGKMIAILAGVELLGALLAPSAKMAADAI